MSHLYQVTVKGRNLIELKKAVEDLYNELTNGVLSSSPRATIIKDMEAADETNFETEADDEYTEDLASKHLTPAVPVSENVVHLQEVDSTGSVWNASIHSSSKAKNKDGTWKARRNVNGVTTPTVVTPPVQTIQQPVVVTPPPAQVVEAPPVQAPPMPTTMNSGYTLESFVANFPLIISQLITAGKVNQVYLEQCKTYFGVIEIWNITDAQKTEMFNNLVQYNVIAKVG